MFIFRETIVESFSLILFKRAVILQIDPCHFIYNLFFKNQKPPMKRRLNQQY